MLVAVKNCSYAYNYISEELKNNYSNLKLIHDRERKNSYNIHSRVGTENEPNVINIKYEIVDNNITFRYVFTDNIILSIPYEELTFHEISIILYNHIKQNVYFCFELDQNDYIFYDNGSLKI